MKNNCNYTLYLPVKYSSNIRGYWKDNGKVYRDNLRNNVFTINKPDNTILNYYCKVYDQLAIFYTGKNNEAYIYDKRTGKETILYNSITFYHRGFKGLKDKIKELLNTYEGLTIYREGSFYKIAVYY